MKKIHLILSIVVLGSLFTTVAVAQGVGSDVEDADQQKPPYVYRTHRQPPPVYYESVPSEPNVLYYLPLLDYRQHDDDNTQRYYQWREKRGSRHHHDTQQ